MTGRFIAFEGIDGVGKTTQARRLAQMMNAKLTFQLGDTKIGALIRNIVLDINDDNEDDDGENDVGDALNDRTEALLIIADKAQHVAEVVIPALQSGRNVVTDRYTASAFAYQGYGRRLDHDTLAAMMHFATRGITPDLTVLLDMEPAEAYQRLATQRDRIERVASKSGFLGRVRDGYRELLELSAAGTASVDANMHVGMRSMLGRWELVNAQGSPDEVAERVESALAKHHLLQSNR